MLDQPVLGQAERRPDLQELLGEACGLGTRTPPHQGFPADGPLSRITGCHVEVHTSIFGLQLEVYTSRIVPPCGVAGRSLLCISLATVSTIVRSLRASACGHHYKETSKG